MRQVEEARLQTKYIEFELTHRQENNSYGNSCNLNQPCIKIKIITKLH